MAEKKIKAVLFDIGETLMVFGKVDVVRLFKEGGGLAYKFLNSLNQPTGSPTFFLFRHLIIIRFFNILSNITGRDFDSFELLKKTEEKKGVRLSPQQWQDFAWCWYEPLSKLAKIEPDIKETLNKLKSAGIKLGILSNTFVNAVTLDKHLGHLGLLEFFPVRIYSYNFKFRKPDNRIFIEAARQMQTEPGNILFVGDRLEADIKGAKNTNMFAVLKKAYTNVKKAIPNGITKIENLSELPEIVEKINCR